MFFINVLQDRVEQLLQSCHFNPEWLAAPLTEAAGRGHVEVTQAGHVEVTFADLEDLKKGSVQQPDVSRLLLNSCFMKVSCFFFPSLFLSTVRLKRKLKTDN